MRVSTFEIFQRGLEGILKQQKAVSDVQLQISTGKRVIKPSDDPVAATRALILRQDKSAIEQYLGNADNASSNLEAEETALKSVNIIYQRIRELALQSANSTTTLEDRSTIAAEMRVRLDELVSLANSKNPDNEFLFSGTLGRVQSVIKSNNQYLYQGDDGQRHTQIGDSLSIPISDTGKDIFFNVLSSQVNTTSTSGIATTTTAPSFVASGTLTPLATNDLKINNVLINPAAPDGVSTTDASASGLALANAINANNLEHGVRAYAEPTVFNLGILSPGALVAGDLTINGVQVIDPTGTEDSFLAVMQSLEAQTGVVASRPGGPGTDIILTAQDGRNTQLQTTGTSVAANWSNFDLTSGANDRVQTASVTLRSEASYQIGGATPANAGLSAGTTSVTANTGTGSISQPTILTPLADVNESYSIIFNAGGTTFDIVADSNPLVPLTGFDNVPYVSGSTIEFNGLQVAISGAPNAGDVFGIQFDQPTYQNAFTAIENLIDSVQSTADKRQLSYEIGVGLENLDFAETKTLEARARVGARLNIIDNQKDVHDTLSILNAENLSNLEDLDYAKAISELTQRTTALEAAQASYVRIQSLSLFNFLR